MPKATTTFSISVGPMPAWYPAWQGPGVIKEIPNSSFATGIAQNGWTAPPDPAPGGTSWPRGLYAFSGGTVGYINAQPYFLLCGGGHATTSDNSIYAFGPLYGPGSDTPSWSRYGPLSADADIVTCQDRYLDGRPSSRHTAGDFSYGVGSDGKARIIMTWVNSWYCGNGGAHPGTDVFDMEAQEWDGAKSPPINHPAHSLRPAVHSCGVFHPHTGLWYSKGRGSDANSLASYDPVTLTYTNIRFSGLGQQYDSSICTMGPRNYVYFFKSSTDSHGRIDVTTGVGEDWGQNPPSNTRSTVAYDSVQDRIYTPTTGVAPSPTNQNMPPGTKTVAWFDASAGTNPTWQSEIFNGDTPDQQISAGTFGRWSFIPELKGFLLNNAYDSSVYFYKTSP